VISGSFAQRIQELRDALTIRTALGVDIAIKKLEELTQMLNEREARFTKGVQMCGGTDEYFENEREKRFAKEVHMRGGMDLRFESEDKLAELVKFAKQQEARPQNQVQSAVPSKDVNRPPSQSPSGNGSVAEKYRLDASLLHELRTPLNSLLDENRALFMFKLDTQTSIIQGAIKDSETRIIWALNSRFRRVKDLVSIRQLSSIYD
jgi:signal transduction histidine kinase